MNDNAENFKIYVVYVQVSSIEMLFEEIDWYGQQAAITRNLVTVK